MPSSGILRRVSSARLPSWERYFAPEPPVPASTLTYLSGRQPLLDSTPFSSSGVSKGLGPNQPATGTLGRRPTVFIRQRVRTTGSPSPVDQIRNGRVYALCWDLMTWQRILRSTEE